MKNPIEKLIDAAKAQIYTVQPNDFTIKSFVAASSKSPTTDTVPLFEP